MKMQKFPKVKFEILHIDKVFPTISYFLHPESNTPDWSGAFFDCYPKLKAKLKNVKTLEESTDIEYEFFLNHFNTNFTIIEQRQQTIQKMWDKIEKDIMIALAEIVEYKWSKPKQIIHSYLTQNPICPRSIENREFHLFYNKSFEDMIETTIHELLHFIYFDKWQSVFPKTKKEEYVYPHLVWYLSEIITQVLLNDERIQRIFKYYFTTYDEFQNIMIDGHNLIDVLNDMYYKRTGFDKFLKESYRLFQRNQKIITTSF